jgi:DNA-binding Xre family transcriptional regulator
MVSGINPEGHGQVRGNRGESVQTDILLKICKATKCDTTEILEIEYDKSGNL